MVLDLYAEFRKIIETLNEAGVPYAVVGAIAVSLKRFRSWAQDQADLEALGPEEEGAR